MREIDFPCADSRSHARRGRKDMKGKREMQKRAARPIARSRKASSRHQLLTTTVPFGSIELHATRTIFLPKAALEGPDFFFRTIFLPKAALEGPHFFFRGWLLCAFPRITLTLATRNHESISPYPSSQPSSSKGSALSSPPELPLGVAPLLDLFPNASERSGHLPASRRSQLEDRLDPASSRAARSPPPSKITARRGHLPGLSSQASSSFEDRTKGNPAILFKGSNELHWVDRGHTVPWAQRRRILTKLEKIISVFQARSKQRSIRSQEIRPIRRLLLRRLLRSAAHRPRLMHQCIRQDVASSWGSAVQRKRAIARMSV